MSDSSESESERRCSTPEFKKLKRGESSKGLRHRAQKYRPEWEERPEFKGWLVAAKDNKKGHCRACNIDMTAEITVLKNHAKSNKHVLKSKSIPKKSISDIFKKSETSLDAQKKTAEIKLTAFLTEHNISFRCANHLVKVVQQCCPDSKIASGLKLGRTKATQIAKNVLGRYSETDVVSLLKINKFSLIIDESTDIASLKTLCVCVRLFHPELGKIVTLFWKLVQIFSGNEPDNANEGATAERLHNEIQNSLQSNNIPLENLIGFASDGCNTMFGKYNSVASKLQATVPGIMVQKCICHSLHLCASEACKCLPRMCEDMARNIYGFFKNSAKRQAMFMEYQHFCNVDPHKILRPSQTRWLSLLTVVRRILEQWDALKLFFTTHYVEHRLIASEEIYNALNNSQIKLFFMFLDWVLPKFVDLNKYFQSEKVVILNLHEKMVTTYKDLLLAYMEPNYIKDTDIEKIDPTYNIKFVPLEKMYLGIKVMQNINNLQEMNIKQDFYIRCRSFLMTAANQIKKRYNFQDPILNKLQMLQQKSIKNYETLLPLMNSLPSICDINNTHELQKIDDQWRMLKSYDDLPQANEDDEFYFKLSKITGINGEPLFPHLCKFVLNVLALPHSSASCERIFSKVNIVKTKSRNKLITSTLNGILLSSQCVSLQEGCTNFTPNKQMLELMTSDNMYSENKDEEDILFEEIYT